MQLHKKSGFSLVELSIVIVVIGLLIAGVFSGKELIANSKRNKIISDLKSFKIAFSQFEDKYSSVPGDMSDATQYFGGTTNNGNGTKIINDAAPSVPTYDEAYLFWQHLTISRFLNGSYSGSSSAPNVDAPNIGVNVPKALGKSTKRSYLYYKATKAAIGVSNQKLVSISINKVNDLVGAVVSGIDADTINSKMDGVALQGSNPTNDVEGSVTYGCAVIINETWCRFSYILNGEVR